VLAEGLVVHEQVAQVAVAVDLVDPVGELLGVRGATRPPAVAEAEGDVVGEAVVLEEQTTGVPWAMASRATRPNGSLTLGITKQSAWR
jgi:hypothetical protein